MRIRLSLALLAAGLAAGPARGHDMWIAPSSFTPAAGELVRIHLRVGHPAQGVEPVVRQPQRIARFALLGPAGEALVLGQDGTEPAGLARPVAAGLHLLAYESSHALSELPAERFEAYLIEEGLERISALRVERGQTAAGGRERYSRGLKALLAVGGSAAGADRPLGLPFELVAEANPYALASGAALAVSALFRGEPVAGILVEAARLDGTGRAIHARTGPDGRASLRLGEAGDWMLAAVHMVEAPEGSGVEWESFWASLTFALPDR